LLLIAAGAVSPSASAVLVGVTLAGWRKALRAPGDTWAVPLLTVVTPQRLAPGLF
jgi:hypothetical protein